jgi:hypothetical protein
VLKLLHTFYAAVGNPPTVDGALAVMAKALLTKASIDQISIALDACMFEKFPVRIPHILARIPGLDVDANAEKRLAWDVLEAFVSKWVRWADTDRCFTTIARGAPTLSPRIVDTVRRSGSWSVYLALTDKDFPFQQNRFFEEYEAWNEVQVVAADPARVLEMPKFKELAAGMSLPGRIIPLERPAVRNIAQAAEPISPQKARIMKAIANTGKPRRL